MTLDNNGKAAFETMVVTIGIVTAFLGVIVWFIFWIQSDVEETRLKHETCMVETTTSTMDATVTVISYCSPKQEP